MPSMSQLTRSVLPAWPVTLPFAAYVVWWLVGVGDFIWIIAAALMVLTWAGRKNMRFPVVMWLWLVYLIWVVASLAMNDTTGRALGAIYRFLLYASAGLFALHIFNARTTVTVRRMGNAMVWFLVGMTAAGYLALAFPTLTIRTPMSYLIPNSLQQNELIADMVIRHTTHWNPDAWIEQAVRPVAPFLYANTWGNVYSLLLPLVLIHLWVMWHTRQRWWIIAVILLSVLPALSTLNRGMFIGLAVVGVWVAVQALRRGAFLITGMWAAVGALALGGWVASPFGFNLIARVTQTESTQDRRVLYRDTIAGTMESPLFGFGSPRPAAESWLPSVGTQGQLWTVMYSHGFIGLGLFLGFLVCVLALMWKRQDPVGAVLGGIVAATLVETIFYGMMTGIFITMVAVGLGLRADTIVNSSDRPGKLTRTRSTAGRFG
ncbi:hypothetical protein CCYS_10455 [Corynebacterium cystitidis DSM 20524]|uniref:O-antigen ligase like membrane protein n=2 Tax=Corynebacterium cystitidis TaxID=35757 RepID=A0A1H9W2S3_9CORY|nr:hypothetical protein CCYS_10455 [Corynebacterium cystitidis DSM 20524]SES28061.1 hypothetical protein SAMN05661109_02505 [Corynebacterium cystitidis DSM 20524]SNV64759.1 Lipid A core - O-antigen ligase and related enzymes [Corynebacterium cystitidis]